MYRLQPVYAIVSGIADEDWSPIDAFCAKHRIPAVLPQTPLPPARPADGFYSFYFSKGVALEAQAIAGHLAAAAARPEGRAAGVAMRNARQCGRTGARARARRRPVTASECVPPSATLSAETWRSVIGDADTLVLWLDAADLDGLDVLAGSGAIDRVTEIYLSSSLLGEDALRVPEPVASARDARRIRSFRPMNSTPTRRGR